MSPTTAVRFTLDERQSWDFARLSGDFNPLHVDAVAARRLQFGGTVCHGVHLVLQALDLALALDPSLVPERLESIGAVFGSSVRTGTEVAVALVSDQAVQRVRLVASADGRALFTAKLQLRAPIAALASPVEAAPSLPSEPICPRFEELAALSDRPTFEIPIQLNSDLARALFPALSSTPTGLSLIADLAATTNIIGIRCPGQHSIYSEFKLRRRDTGRDQLPSAMSWTVQRTDARFRSVRIGVDSAAYQGTLDAFFRAPPVDQPKLVDLLPAVPRDRFAGQRALVVGGSRGLGELLAKLLLAGGATVTLTYARGRADAERICGEAAALSLPAQAWSLDASQPLPPELAEQIAAAQFSHVYYFATPQIAKNSSGTWNVSLFTEFCSFYVRGFSEVVRAAARARGTESLTAFYPSTVFLDQPEKGFAEYCTAKAAGEVLCDHLAQEPGLVLHKPRLPRLQTDQNSSFLGVEGEAPLAVLLAMLEAMAPSVLHAQGHRPE